MKKIYSKIKPSKLLHLIQRLDEINQPRVNIIPEEHFLQCSTLKMENNTNSVSVQKFFLKVAFFVYPARMFT